ncbi:hypothetical protein [Terrisporobacter sp.]|uniref:hypothetical protein n=1 Tax=Terrisporobacter sp. TaxID=1965305 RepID=UPI002624C06C|nr:hypothetical protein [Terrisporobacter sp.]
MKKYEVMREIYNPCSGKYFFDIHFQSEVYTDNIEETLNQWFYNNLPKYDKYNLSDGTIIYVLQLPILERYTFSEIQ